MLATETLYLKTKDATENHSYFLEFWQKFGQKSHALQSLLLVFCGKNWTLLDIEVAHSEGCSFIQFERCSQSLCLWLADVVKLESLFSLSLFFPAWLVSVNTPW